MKYLSFRAVAISLVFVFLAAATVVVSNSGYARSRTNAAAPVYGIEVTKVATLNGQPVDEVCGGQTVTSMETGPMASLCRLELFLSHLRKPSSLLPDKFRIVR
jgi:hypothetical protein